MKIPANEQYAIDGIRYELAQYENGGYLSADYIQEKLNILFQDKQINFKLEYKDNG